MFPKDPMNKTPRNKHGAHITADFGYGEAQLPWSKRRVELILHIGSEDKVVNRRYALNLSGNHHMAKDLQRLIDEGYAKLSLTHTGSMRSRYRSIYLTEKGREVLLGNS